MKRFTLTAIVATAAVLALSACGSTESPAPASAEPTTPTACLEAIDAADELTGLLGDALDSASRTIGYSLDYDSAAIDEETAYLESITPEVHEARAAYDAAADECYGVSR